MQNDLCPPDRTGRAYEIVNRLEEKKMNEELDFLHGAVTKREAKKGQVHKVFEESFDAKGIYNEKFFMQKLNYLSAGRQAFITTRLAVSGIL